MHAWSMLLYISRGSPSIAPHPYVFGCCWSFFSLSLSPRLLSSCYPQLSKKLLRRVCRTFTTDHLVAQERSGSDLSWLQPHIAIKVHRICQWWSARVLNHSLRERESPPDYYSRSPRSAIWQQKNARNYTTMSVPILCRSTSRNNNNYTLVFPDFKVNPTTIQHKRTKTKMITCFDSSRDSHILDSHGQKMIMTLSQEVFFAYWKKIG